MKPTGKTSLIQAIAGELGLHVYIISLSRAGLDDTSLGTAIGDLPGKCIALMEDIDAAFTRGITRDQGESVAEVDGGDDKGPKPAGPKGAPVSRVTLSGLLNALDGVGAQEGRILFATTNRYHSLDAALVRPGRLDLHIEFKYASTFQVAELFRTFYMPDVRKTDKEKEADKEATKSDAKSKEAVPAIVEEKAEEVPLIDLGSEKPPVAPPTPSSTRSTSPTTETPAPDTTGTPATDTTAPLEIGTEHAKAGLAYGTSHSARAPTYSVDQYEQLANEFAAQIPADTFSMAALQGYLMTYKIRPADAVKDVKVWVEKEMKDRKKTEAEPKPIVAEPKPIVTEPKPIEETVSS